MDALPIWNECSAQIKPRWSPDRRPYASTRTSAPATGPTPWP